MDDRGLRRKNLAALPRRARLYNRRSGSRLAPGCYRAHQKHDGGSKANARSHGLRNPPSQRTASCLSPDCTQSLWHLLPVQDWVIRLAATRPGNDALGNAPAVSGTRESRKQTMVSDTDTVPFADSLPSKQHVQEGYNYRADRVKGLRLSVRAFRSK